jgi:hypothetical protein
MQPYIYSVILRVYVLTRCIINSVRELERIDTLSSMCNCDRREWHHAPLKEARGHQLVTHGSYELVHRFHRFSYHGLFCT